MSKAATQKVAALVVHCFATAVSLADPAHGPSSSSSVFSLASTPAQSIYGLSVFVLAITAAVSVLVFSLLAYAVIKFRERAHDDKREPPQVYGSSQLETAWTVIPILIVLVLFLATGRVIANVQEAANPHAVLEFTGIGHQIWWEYRSTGINVLTAIVSDVVS
jgi:cytochrome c oxidase subunit 2